MTAHEPRPVDSLSRSRDQVEAIEKWTETQQRTQETYRAEQARAAGRCSTCGKKKPSHRDDPLCTSCRYLLRKAPR